MSDMIGMAVEAVRRTASELRRKAGEIRAVEARVDAIVSQINGSWHGNRARQFVGDWHGHHRAALLLLADRVDGLGQSALNNAGEQETASGGGGSHSSGTAAVGFMSFGAAVAAGAGAAGRAVADAGRSAESLLKVASGVHQAAADVVIGAVGSATGLWAIRHGEPTVSHRVTMAGLGDVLQSGADLGPATEDPNTSAVRIVRINHPGEPPSWIVVIPGTDFGGTPGDPSNTGANVPLMLAHRSDLLDEIRRTMHDAGIKPGDPVMVSGFSQGGIAAMALASDPQGFHITNVLTAGSPVGWFDPPDGVKITSIEHAGDPVPSWLDLRENPDTSDWDTFSAVAGPGFPHDAALYAETARHLEATGQATLPPEFHAEPGSAVQFDYTLQRELDVTPTSPAIRSVVEQATHVRPMVI